MNITDNCKTLIILGMHRSGTSSLAGSLQENGIYLGDVHTYNTHNTKGNRENSAIVELNDAILEANLSSWDSPPTKTIEWNTRLLNTRTSIISEMREKAEATHATYWGFKDPRVIFTLPFWQNAKLKIQFVGTFRHPLSVALSLFKRDKTPIEEGLNLWKIYNTAFLNIYEANPFPLVCFDVSDEQYLLSLRYIYQELSISNIHCNQNSFFDNNLRTNKESSINYSLPDEIESLHLKLLNIYKSQEHFNLS